MKSDTFHARAALALGARYIEQHKLMQRQAPDSSVELGAAVMSQSKPTETASGRRKLFPWLLLLGCGAVMVLSGLAYRRCDRCIEYCMLISSTAHLPRCGAIPITASLACTGLMRLAHWRN